MHRNGFGNAAQHESVDAAVAVRADHDQVRTPVLRLIQDDLSGVAYRQKFGFDSLDARFTQYLLRTSHSFLGPPPCLFLDSVNEICRRIDRSNGKRDGFTEWNDQWTTLITRI